VQDSRLRASGGSESGFAAATVSDMVPANAPYPFSNRPRTSSEIVSRLESLNDGGVRAALYIERAGQTVDEKIRIAVEARRKRASIQDPSASTPQYPSATPYSGPQNPWMSPQSAPRYPSVSPMAKPE
jgi:hypothetical protein